MLFIVQRQPFAHQLCTCIAACSRCMLSLPVSAPLLRIMSRSGTKVLALLLFKVAQLSTKPWWQLLCSTTCVSRGISLEKIGRVNRVLHLGTVPSPAAQVHTQRKKKTAWVDSVLNTLQTLSVFLQCTSLVQGCAGVRSLCRGAARRPASSYAATFYVLQQLCACVFVVCCSRGEGASGLGRPCRRPQTQIHSTCQDR